METKKSILAYLHDLSILLAVILAAFLLVFRIVVVSGPSMMSTLENGDYLIVINQFFAGNR
jgi:signal peptidase I